MFMLGANPAGPQNRGIMLWKWIKEPTRMKISLLGSTGVTLGKHNVKDHRLDAAHPLVEAQKKTYVQVDVTGEDEAQVADAIVVTKDSRLELIFQDLEFIETRMGRNPEPAEVAVLKKLQTALESEQLVTQAGLSPEEWQAVTAHAFATAKPVVVAEPGDLENFDEFLPRVLAETGWISYLTVGGKENRAWLIRKGSNASEAAGAIHSDLQKGLIRAEVISYADLIEAGGETQAKRANKLRLEQRTYIVQDYDVVNFRSNK
jgi:ribosome-binding ATPase YchF (GTP1/OBG family)